MVNVDPHLTQTEGSIVTAQLALLLSLTVDEVVFDECSPRRVGPNYFRVEPCVRREHVDGVDVRADLRR